MKKSIKNFIVYWLPFYLYAALIFISSSISHPLPEEWSFPHIDKIIHTIEYAVFCLLLIRALEKSTWRLSAGSIYIWAVCITIFYGFTDEIHQIFVVARNASAVDLLFDGLGASLGAIIYSMRGDYGGY